MEESRREKAEKKVTVTAALGIGVVCIMFGLPLWWKTTTVYRVELPYTEISQLKTLKMTTRVSMSVIYAIENMEEKAFAVFADKVRHAVEGLEYLDPVFSINYMLKVRKAKSDEMTSYIKARNLQDLEEIFDDVENKKTSNYKVIILPQNGNGKFQVTKSFVGKNKISFVNMKTDLESTIQDVSKIVKHVYVNEDAMLRAFRTTRSITHSESDKEGKRTVRSHPGYQLTFSLLNPQPDIVAAHWDVPTAVEDYLRPLLKKLEEFTHLEVKSQYLHYLGMGVRPRKDEQKAQSLLRQEDLPHIVNPIEAYLGSHVSNYPDLNFVVYVPSRDQSPLLILDKSDKPTKSNSFLIPRWGGFMVHNVEVPENSTLPLTVDLDMRHVMEVFISQIRLLLGITTQDYPKDIDIAQPGNEAVSQWELELWLRKRSIENLVSSVATLNSLADLLEKISNMIINDDIGREVDKATMLAGRTFHLLSQGELREAYISSRKALIASEKAFFDPSLLELLYFPEDQKFAIYIPLFLPIGIPIVMSVIQAAKYLTKKTDKAKTE